MTTHIMCKAGELTKAFVAMAAPLGQGGGQQGGIMSLLPMIVMIMAIFYFMVFRPQQKKQKEQKEMIDSVKKGDEVITSGGIHGIVAGLKDDIVVVKVADNVKIDFSKSAIAVVTKKGMEPNESRNP